MPIKIQCSACSNKLTVPDSYAGKRGKCPKCNEQINIPGKGANKQQAKKEKPTEVDGDGFPNFSEEDARGDLSAPNISVPATAAPDLSAPSNSESENPFEVTPRKKGRKVKKAAKVSHQPLELTRSRLRQVGVLSAATTAAVIYAFLGLLLGLAFAAITLLGTILGASSGPGGGDILAFGIGSAIASIIFLPIFYGLIGFIGGALASSLYNLAAKLTGGLEFKFDH